MRRFEKFQNLQRLKWQELFLQYKAYLFSAGVGVINFDI